MTEPASPDRLHPESLRQLRDLVKLHGAPQITAAVATIAAERYRDMVARNSAATRISTPNFVSLAAARRYYRPYGFDNTGVDAKLAAAEIHIGKPMLQPGDTLAIIDGGRYEITRMGKP